jgi:hypothetical protein
MIRTIARLAAVAGSLMVLAVVPATASANTPTATIQFVNQAQLQPDGTALVSLYYQCNPGYFGSTSGFVVVYMEQPGAFGSASTPANCNDQKQKLTLDLGPGPFTRGTATASANVFNGVAFGSSFTNKQAELTVR